MKQIRNTCALVVLFSVYGVFFLSDFAQSYQDEFEVLKKKNWEHWGEYAIWKTENGILKGWIQSPPDLGGGARPTIELLQFKDTRRAYENVGILNDGELIQRQINNPGYEKFTITVKNIGEKQSDFGIALGKLLPDLGGSYPFFYLFLTHKSYSVRFNGWGGVAFGPSTGRIPLNPDTRWQTNELEFMELRFNKGHIHWYADGEIRADFKDTEFSTTEILGFSIIGDGLRAGYAWADSFKITEAVLAVSPHAKLSTTWGQLKQQE